MVILDMKSPFVVQEHEQFIHFQH